MRFMILFETPDILGVSHGSVIDLDEEFSPGVSKGERFLQEMNYLAESYYDSAGYHKIDQQPVVFIYLMRDLINHQPYFDTLKSNMEAKGFDLYLIGDVIHWQNPVDGLSVPGSRAADWGFYKTHFKAISGYSLYDPSRYPTNGLEDKFLSDVEAHWETWTAHINANGLKFVPFIMPGYDDRRLRGTSRPILGRDGGQFYSRQWAMAQSFVDSDVPHVALTSFNEWHEGTEIEPSLQYGASYLDDTRELFRARQTAWGTPKGLRQITGAIQPKTLHMTSDGEIDEFLSALIDRARSHVTSYLKRTYEDEPVPAAVKEVTLRLASNLYNHALKVRQGPLVQAGEFEVQLTDDAVFTESLRRDLAPFRRQTIRIIYP